MTVVVADWYRSPLWTEAARADFEVRLARSRAYNRQQYLRIKGLSVRAAGNAEGARDLLQRAADHVDGHLHETVAVWEVLADMAAEQGDSATAELLYRRVLTAQPDLSGTTGNVEMSLAELLLDTGRPDAAHEALALLNAWIGRDHMKVDNDLFRWHLDLIRGAQAVGDDQTVRRAASTALSLVGRGPQLPRHPGIGLVQTDRATIRRLRKLAR